VAEEKKGSTCPEADVLAVGRTLPDGGVTFIRHKNDHTIESGTIVPLPEGAPPPGVEVVHLEHRNGNEYNVTVAPACDGPAMVNSSAYRSNWDSIFGGRQTVGQA
jgi:hypothetical protein